MYDNAQQQIEIWNLAWCLTPLCWSKVVLIQKNSPCTSNSRAKSGIAAVRSLLSLSLWADWLLAPLLFRNTVINLFLCDGWQENLLPPVFTCCEQHAELEWHHPSCSVPSPHNGTGGTWLPGGTCLTYSLKPHLCQGMFLCSRAGAQRSEWDTCSTSH